MHRINFGNENMTICTLLAQVHGTKGVDLAPYGIVRITHVHIIYAHCDPFHPGRYLYQGCLSMI